MKGLYWIIQVGSECHHMYHFINGNRGRFHMHVHTCRGEALVMVEAERGVMWP